MAGPDRVESRTLPIRQAAMTRLQSELNRLYLAAQGDAAASWFDAQGRVRALVLEAAQPATWETLARVWQGVQAELDLPAPAIAVSGTDGLQLWFSLEAPIDVATGHAFLDALRTRWLADVAPARVRLLPDPAAPRPLPPVPAPQADEDHWSAFVAPDLAAIFSETPWLDVEPGEEGQAALLRGLQSIKGTVFAEALARLRTGAGDALAPAPMTTSATDDPRAFLVRVMNDESVPLALRIEAAKALLRTA
jgi:hypothetical protein